MARTIIASLILAFVLFLFLSIFIKSLRFDFVNGGGTLSSSPTKEESIERGVYVCDLKLLSFKKKNDSIDFKVKEAWIEKVWRTGTWYWTTHPEGGYNVKVLTTLNQQEENRLFITNDKKSAFGNLEGLGCCCEGQCFGSIKSLPESDTLRYNIRAKNNLDFTKENIVGEVVFVLDRSPN